MKKISLIFKDDADADRWLIALKQRAFFDVVDIASKAEIKVSKRKRKAKAAINKATL